MASVATYLNFPRETEEAFNYYKSVFGTEFLGEIHRFAGVPGTDGQPIPADHPDANLVMHVSLPITGGHLLMGTDAPESMGFTVNSGNNMYIMVMPDAKEEADRLFGELSKDGEIEMEMADQFWGDYFGSCKDKFGIGWMFDVPSNKQG